MLEDGEFWVFTYPKGRVLSARPVFADKEHDLAILELSEPVKLRRYAIFNATTTIGQPIVVVGNTLGSMKWFISYGIISEKEFFYDLTTATIHGGNSGGPWVDLNGRVVALTDCGLVKSNGQEEGISGGVDGETLKQFVDNWKHPNMFQILLGG
jgi:S1-C subfamily serine protease